jgi:hypothetical protein
MRRELMDKSFARKVEGDLREVLSRVGVGRPLGEQFEPISIARAVEDALYQAGWRFTQIDVPSKSRGDIVIQGTKGEQFIDVAIAYREESADVEVSIGRTDNIEGVSDPNEIVTTIMGLAGGERPAAPVVRERMNEKPQQDRIPGWMRLRDRPRTLGGG